MVVTIVSAWPAPKAIGVSTYLCSPTSLTAVRQASVLGSPRTTPDTESGQALQIASAHQCCAHKGRAPFG